MSRNSLRSINGREKIDDRGPWQVDHFAVKLAKWLATKPLRRSIIEVNGQPVELSVERHPSASELRQMLRHAALHVRKEYLNNAEVAIAPVLTSRGKPDWDQIYRRPDIPMQEYQKRIKEARLAVQSLLKCNFEHVPVPPELRQWEVPTEEFEQERFWKDYHKELASYHADFFESLEKAHDMLLEVEAGLIKSVGPVGKKKNWQLRAGSLAVWACTLTIASSVDEHHQPPDLLIRGIRRAVWRDAGLPTAKKTRSGFDEDNWIDKQLKPFMNPSKK